MDDLEYPPHLPREKQSTSVSRYTKLKMRGHALIRTLHAAGIETEDCYQELAIRLNRGRVWCHFSMMRDVRTLDRAITVLEDLCRELQI